MKDDKRKTLMGEHCHYRRGGVCTEHGPGAKRHWKPTWKKTVGRGGRVQYEYTRTYYYTCDLGPNGRAVGQQRLSFSRTAPPTNQDVPDDEDTTQGDLGQQPTTGGNH